MTRGHTGCNHRQGELGAEQRCSRCKEWWPADGDFFYGKSNTRNGLHEWCKAYYREWRANTPGKAQVSCKTVVVEKAAPLPDLAAVPWLSTLGAA